jgi:hypothetical protein
MTSYLFQGGRFLDPRQDALIDGISMLIEGDRVLEVSNRDQACERDRPDRRAPAVRVWQGEIWRGGRRRLKN